MIYRRRFTVRAPLAAVEEFHRSVESFRALAPPGVPIRIHRAAEPLAAGTTMAFTLWLGAIPVFWQAKIEALPEGGAGFLDRQTSGPFRSWVHRHRFEGVDGETTAVDDEIEATLRPHLLWGPVGLQMWLGLPLLFRYRAWRTRRLLER